MEKLEKNLFQEDDLTMGRKAYAGILACTTMIGGTVTRCCNPSGMCWRDVGQ